MRILVRWDADRADAALELGGERIACRLDAQARLALHLLARGALSPGEARAALDALLDADAVAARLGPSVAARLVELWSQGDEGPARPCGAWVLRREGARWRLERPVGRWARPLVGVEVAWRARSPTTQGALRAAGLGLVAGLTLTPAWWRSAESLGLAAGLRLLPDTWPDAPPPLGVLLVPPNATGAARHDRAPLAEAVAACLAQGADWVAVDVPVNRTAPGMEALASVAADAPDRVLLGLGRDATPSLLPAAPDALSALWVSVSGYAGGSRLRTDLNLSSEAHGAAGLAAEACLPVLGWTMAQRLRPDGPPPAVYAALDDRGAWQGWTSFAVPAQALDADNGTLIVQDAATSEGSRACAPGRGVIAAYADWRAEPEADRMSLPIAGRAGADLLDGVEARGWQARVPGPVSQALLAQGILTGPIFRTWPIVVADALGAGFPLSPCDRGGLQARATPSRTWLVVLAMAVWLAATGAGFRAALASALAPRAVGRRAGALGAGLVGLWALGLALGRIYLPVVAGLVALGFAALERLARGFTATGSRST